MDEQQIRRIAQEEIRKSAAAGVFKMQNIPYHIHNGQDSQQISQDNIIPSISVSGSITFAQETTYTINLNSRFTPSSIIAYGNIVGNTGQRYLSVGTANLTPSFYLQPQGSTSVVAGNIQYPFTDPNLGTTVPLQSSAYFGAESAGGAMRTIVSEGHIVSVEYPSGTIHARATVTSFSRNAILLVVSDLDSGWEMNINYVIT